MLQLVPAWDGVPSGVSRVCGGSVSPVGFGVYTSRETGYIWREHIDIGGFARPGDDIGLGESNVANLENLEERILGIVSEQLSVSRDEVKLESNFIDDLKADSLDLVELVMEFEDEFGITVPDEDYEKIRTVADAIKYIREKASE